MAAVVGPGPTQPPPPILASDLCPPPVWPLDSADWLMLPTVPIGFPTGPFTPPVYANLGDGACAPSSCPGTGLCGPPVTTPPGGGGTTTAFQVAPPMLTQPPPRFPAE